MRRESRGGPAKLSARSSTTLPYSHVGNRPPAALWNRRAACVSTRYQNSISQQKISNHSLRSRINESNHRHHLYSSTSDRNRSGPGAEPTSAVAASAEHAGPGYAESPAASAESRSAGPSHVSAGHDPGARTRAQSQRRAENFHAH